MAVVQKVDAPDADPGKIKDQSERIRWRAVIFGLLLIPAIGRWLFEGEMVRYTYTTWAAPFYNAIFVLTLVTLANMAIGKATKWHPLNRLELLAIYAIVSVASALLSTDFVGILFSIMGHSTRFATSSNEWNTLFGGVLPSWLMVNDAAALKAYYEGDSSIYVWSHFKAWLTPSLYWMIFITALFVSFLSMSVLLRKQWMESERLTFPIVQLPLAMADSPAKFFSDKLMWLGLAIAGGITLLNGMHYLNPAIPEIAIRRRDFPIFASPPWNVVNPIRVAFYFFAITLGFLMPLDLSVSCWVFYVLYQVERVFVASVGITGAAPYYDDQAFGAYMAIGIFGLWGTRKHLARAFSSAFLGGPKGEDRDEPASYKTAFLGLGLSIAVMLVFLNLAGMTLGVAIFFLTILMALAVAITRIRAELGFPVHDLHNMGPHHVMTRLVGPENLSRTTLGAFASFHWTCRVFRSHPMPHQMESLKLAGGSGRANRDMFRTILIAGLVTIPICFWVFLDGFYKLGAGTARVGPWATGFGGEAFWLLENWLKVPEVPLTGRWVAIGFGALIAVSLSIARSRVLGFPLHPLGYAVANSWGMFNLWLPIFLGSVAKAVVLRAGGLKTYRKATMFFFGLMLGEFLVGCSWTIFGMIFGIRTYDFWP